MVSPALPPASDLRVDLLAARPAPANPRTATAAREFEAMALGALLQPMFDGLGQGGPFGGGAAEALWRPVLVNEIARMLAETGGLGIASVVLHQAGAKGGAAR